jgi:sirohydrochlorin ferrochelatase
MTANAVFFVTHGSSDRRSWLNLQNLVAIANSAKYQIKFPEIAMIGGGCLEGQAQTLAQQLEAFVQSFDTAPQSPNHQSLNPQSPNHQSPITNLLIMPLFLLSGMHVSEDIPAEVAIAKANLQAKFTESYPKLAIAPHLGTDPQIPHLIAQRFADADPDAALVLIAHGSRRAGANQVIEDIAHHARAIAAYWSVEPKIDVQIEKLICQGYRKIGVIPYFLTEGGITEAIAQKLNSYDDRLQIQHLALPLSDNQIIEMALSKAAAIAG